MSPESLQYSTQETAHDLESLSLSKTLDALRKDILSGTEDEKIKAMEDLASMNGHAVAYMYHTLENGLDTSSQTEDAENAVRVLSILVTVSDYIARYTDGKSEYTEMRPEMMANIDKNVQSAVFAVLLGSGQMKYSAEEVTHIAGMLEMQINMAMELANISLDQAHLQGREPVISEQMQEDFGALKEIVIKRLNA